MRRPDAVYLHIGAPKTGTTYLQGFLWGNRHLLTRAGLLYPGAGPARQFRAVLDLQQSGFVGHEMSAEAGAWARLVDEVHGWHSRSVISHELMSGLSEARIRSAVESLAPRDVHVILSVRDLSRIVPATWQEVAKNQQIESWPDFLDRVRPRDDGRDPGFWDLQDVPAILRRWSAVVPADRIHVVTVPPSGSPRHLLLSRFAEVLAFDAEDYDQRVQVANDSLGAVEVALLHRINLLSRERLSWEAYHHAIKHTAVPHVLANRSDQVRVGLPAAELDWVHAETRRTVDTIRSLGADVVGDLDDLTPRPPEAPDSVSATPEQQLEAAVELVVGLSGRLHGASERQKELREELDAARYELDSTRVERAKRRVVRLGKRTRVVDAALNVYRSARSRR